MDGREVRGTVVAQLPRALYRVAVDGGSDLVAHLAASPARNVVRVLVGDRVRVALMPADPRRGRIVAVEERR